MEGMWYAQLPRRRAAQITLDLTVAAWCAFWVWAGVRVHHRVAELAAPALRLRERGLGFDRSLEQLEQSLGQVPMIGDRLREATAQVGGGGQEAAAAAGQFADSVAQLALALGAVTMAIPVLLAAAPWLARRLRFVRSSREALHILDSADDLDLFALRALATRPVALLARIDDDPAGAWRRGDARVVRELAALELREHGLRPPGVAGGRALD